MTSRERELLFDLSGIGICYRCLPPPLAERLRGAWAPFESARDSGALLSICCEAAPAIADAPAFEPRQMASSFSAVGAVFTLPEGAIEVSDSGEAALRIDPTEPEKQFLALVNLTTAALAWRLPVRGGALLHAAAVVIDGRGFALVGPEGSGKSTFSLLARDAGATLVSDDVALVTGAEPGGYELLGSPIRAFPHGANRPGRWPLAALLLPEWGASARLTPAPGILVRARILANLPFVIDAAASDDRASKAAERLAASTPARVLTFPRDSSFLPLLRSFSERSPPV